MVNFRVNSKHSNARVLETPSKYILISYSTVVAFFDKVQQQAYKTDKNWSVTTNKHIGLFLNDLQTLNPKWEVKTKPQEILDTVIP